MAALRVDVEPRVISPRTGDRILLVDAVENFLTGAGRGVIRIEGPALEVAGAMERLVAHFGDVICDGRNFSPVKITVLANDSVVVVTNYRAPRTDLILALAAWDEDDIVDFLLSHHRQVCGSVIDRVRRSDAIWRPTTGIGWRQALSTLAFHPEFGSLQQAIKFLLDSHLVSESEAEVEEAFNLPPEDTESESCAAESPPRISSWFACDAAYLNCMKLDFLVGCIRQQQFPSNFVLRSMSPALICQLAIVVNQRKVDYSFLNDPSSYAARFQSVAASLLARLDSSWRPRARGWGDLRKANFANVVWPGWKLAGNPESLICFDHARFDRADLKEAELEHLSFRFASLCGTTIREASFHGCDLRNADLSRADLVLARFKFVDAADVSLRAANLRSASLDTVNLQHVNLTAANLEMADLKECVLNHSDFSETNLRGARLCRCALKHCDLRTAMLDFAKFESCRMERCNLENVEATEIDFQDADLNHAWLSGSVFRGANFEKANLRGAGLGDIDWEGADLRRADLTNVSFHFGSTRCGLVDSPYPSHGTRTGFYTDDYHDQPFKSPEEIRKANLRGADLRGAILGQTDFYLVDLRDAQIDPHLIPHLKRCGAILESRC